MEKKFGIKVGFTLAEGATHVNTPPTKAKLGFTLAEVLITLGIIGVVAALTIPNLLAHYQKQQTVIKLKKIYSNLQQSIRMATEEYGDCEGWDFLLSQNDFLDKYFVPYLKSSKVTTILNYTDLAGEHNSFGSTIPKLQLPDGAIVIYSSSPFQCKNHLIVDINGTSKPNRVGRDIFVFSFYQNILTTYTQYTDNTPLIMRNRTPLVTPTGTSGQCSKTAKGGIIGPGSYCSRLIERDSWTISKDYPWD